MANCVRQIRISVTRIQNEGSKIGKVWGNRVGRAKHNGRARMAVDGVRTACEAVRMANNVAGREVKARTGGNARHKVGVHEVLAAVRVAMCLEIPSCWLLIRTAMANCLTAKSPMQLPRLGRSTRMATGDYPVMKCDLLTLNGLKVPNAAVRQHVLLVLPKTTTTVRQGTTKASRKSMRMHPVGQHPLQRKVLR